LQNLDGLDVGVVSLDDGLGDVASLFTHDLIAAAPEVD
jgi:hypothetical protein